jgi:hypothetical protein
MRKFLIDHYKKRNLSRVRRLDYCVDTFFKVCQEENNQNESGAKKAQNHSRNKLEKGGLTYDKNLIKKRGESEKRIPDKLK